MKIALVTGVNGQDGSYMADLLLAKGWVVVGTVRGKNPAWPFDFNTERLGLIIERLDLGYTDSIDRIFQRYTQIDAVYNFAAQSHVGDSFACPEETYRVTGVGACLLMDRYFGAFPNGRFYQASTSELYGGTRDAGQTTLEDSFAPLSPYAVAKLQAHYNCERHRKAGRFAVSGILFNHESERRHESFVTQKVAKYVAEAFLSRKPIPKLKLGYLEACRDWGYAPEYMEAVYAAMQKDFPSVWLLGTGASVPVRSLVRSAFERVDLDYRDFVVEDTKQMRAQEVEYLCANPIDLKVLLGREPKQVFEVIGIMIESQLQRQS